MVVKYPVLAVENNNCLLWLNYNKPNEVPLLWWIRPSDGYIGNNNFVYLDSPVNKSFGWTSHSINILEQYKSQDYKPRDWFTGKVIEVPLKEYLKGKWREVL